MTVHPTPRRLAGGTVLLLAVRSAGLVMGLVVTVLLARGLRTSAFGTFATGIALAQIGTTFTEFGLGALLVREGSARPALIGALLSWATRARVVVGTAVSVGLAGVALALVDDRAGRIAVLVLVVTVPLNALTLGMSVLQQRLLLGRIARLLLLQSILWLALVAGLYVTHAGLLAYAVAYVGYTSAYGLLVHRTARTALAGQRESISLREFRRAMRDVVPLSVTAVLITLYYKLDSLFVFEFAGPTAAGVYAVAYRFLDQLQIIPVTLSNVFLPLLTRRRGAGEPTGPTFDRYLRLTLLLCVPVVGVGVVAARPLIVSVFGGEYTGAVVLLRLLLPAFVPVALGYVLSHMAMAHRQARKQLLAATVALAGNVALNLVFVPRYGAPAAALVTLGTECGIVVTLYLTLRAPCELRLPWRWLGRLAGTVLVASATAALSSLADPVLGAMAFAGAYAVGAVVLRTIDPAEVLALLRREPHVAVEQPPELVREGT